MAEDNKPNIPHSPSPQGGGNVQKPVPAPVPP